MITYISLEYCTDGPTPSNIDHLLAEAGLRRHGTYYSMEVAGEEGLGLALDRLHLALQGSGVRYRLYMNIPEPERYRSENIPSGLLGTGGNGPNTGSEVDRSHSGLLEDFRKAEREEHKQTMAHIVSFLRATGGSTLDEIKRACSMEGDELESVVDDMIEEGKVIAHFQGRFVLYRHSGPMLRSLCR